MCVLNRGFLFAVHIFVLIFGFVSRYVCANPFTLVQVHLFSLASSFLLSPHPAPWSCHFNSTTLTMKRVALTFELLLYKMPLICFLEGWSGQPEALSPVTYHSRSPVSTQHPGVTAHKWTTCPTAQDRCQDCKRSAWLQRD